MFIKILRDHFSMETAKSITRVKVVQIGALSKALHKPMFCAKSNVGQSVISGTLKKYKDTGSFFCKKSPDAPQCTSTKTDLMI